MPSRLRHIPSGLREIPSDLREMSSRLRDILSRLRQMSSGLREVSSDFEALDLRCWAAWESVCAYGEALTKKSLRGRNLGDKQIPQCARKGRKEGEGEAKVNRDART